jgi:hypothetical protein
MTTHDFINRLKTLWDIDGDLLPELTAEEQYDFMTDPIRYLIHANDAQAEAIMREVEKRQKPVVNVRIELAACLFEIANADPIDMALDPGWASSIARITLTATGIYELERPAS